MWNPITVKIFRSNYKKNEALNQSKGPRHSLMKTASHAWYTLQTFSASSSFNMQIKYLMFCCQNVEGHQLCCLLPNLHLCTLPLDQVRKDKNHNSWSCTMTPSRIIYVNLLITNSGETEIKYFTAKKKHSNDSKRWCSFAKLPPACSATVVTTNYRA